VSGEPAGRHLPDRIGGERQVRVQNPHEKDQRQHPSRPGSPTQGCQLVCFQTKNSNLGKVWRALEWKVLLYFMVIWNILQSFGIFYGNVVVIWYIFPRFGILCQEKSDKVASQMQILGVAVIISPLYHYNNCI
jgi:hypothetical protein